MRMWFFLAFTLLSLLYAGLSWLDYRLLSRILSPFRPNWFRRVYCLFAATAYVTIGLYWIYEPAVNHDNRYWLYVLLYSSYAWLLTQAVSLSFLSLIWLLRGWWRRKEPLPDRHEAGEPLLSRRAFLEKALVLTPVFTLAIGTHKVWAGDSRIVLRRHELTFAGLPRAYDGLKIAQLSDSHIGPFFTLGRLEQVIGLLQREQPDLLVITGDLIDDLAMLEESLQALEQFTRNLPYGTYFCWGNHEHRKGLAEIRSGLARHSLRLLENENAVVIPGSSPLYLMGVDYPWAGSAAQREAKRRAFVEQAKQGIPPEAFTILLAHHPDFILDGFRQEIPLTLTGHTHGGQIGLFENPVYPLPFAFVRGLYHQGISYGYVNSGAGHCLPIRVGCPAEVAVFTLRTIAV